MATSENNCTDNFSLPRGPLGPKGPRGPSGTIGPIGTVGPQGITGPAGENKIDINIQSGGRPYGNVTSYDNSNRWTQLAYVIFPGTSVWVPQEAKIAYSLANRFLEPQGSIRLKAIKNDGTIINVAEFQLTGTRGATHYYTLATETLNSLPSDESILYLEGAKQYIESNRRYSTQLYVYAFELR